MDKIAAMNSRSNTEKLYKNTRRLRYEESKNRKNRSVVGVVVGTLCRRVGDADECAAPDHRQTKRSSCSFLSALLTFLYLSAACQ